MVSTGAPVAPFHSRAVSSPLPVASSRVYRREMRFRLNFWVRGFAPVPGSGRTAWPRWQTRSMHMMLTGAAAGAGAFVVLADVAVSSHAMGYPRSARVGQIGANRDRSVTSLRFSVTLPACRARRGGTRRRDLSLPPRTTGAAAHGRLKLGRRSLSM